MSKETGVIGLGFLVAIMPLLGFPESWRTAFFILMGIGLVILGFMLRSQSMSNRMRATDAGYARTFEQSETVGQEPGDPTQE